MWSFGTPPDASAWVSLALAVSLVACTRWQGLSRLIERLSQPRAARITVVTMGALALLLSSLYIGFFLRGGPRIIDATSYFLEGRLLSHGALSFDTPIPGASYRGRFLTGPESGDVLGVIFPPGYPLLLALGFLLDRPLWMGPLLAFAMVCVSYGLAWRLFERRDVALLAAALSAVCAALRYHTADTMSHGWAALLLALSLYLASFRQRGFTLLAGVATGWLFATRPLSGVLALVVSAGWLCRDWRRHWWLLALGALPGVVLLLAHQHAVTGSWFTSTQLHYYALADGPPGCFRYGFGPEVGCRHEHAEFVAERLADGFGLWEALRTTAHRVHWHMLDLANFEPLWILMVYAAVVGRKQAVVRTLALAAVGLPLLYLPFYFNGSYPGGGARFLMDTIALEHVLLAWGALRLRLAAWVLPAALFGYAVHAVHGHRALAARDGGRPMFESARTAELQHGLILVASDHGFNLGFDPSARDAHRSVMVARRRGDAHDLVLYEALGEPNTYQYRFDFWNPEAVPTVTPVRFETHPRALRFEAESQWPPLSVAGGWVEPKFLAASCASRGRGLALNPTPGDTVRLELEVHTLEPGSYDLVVGWVRRWGDHPRVSVRLGSAETHLQVESEGPECPSSTLSSLPLSKGQYRFSVQVRGGKANLDFAELRLRDSSNTVKGGSGGNSVDN